MAVLRSTKECFLWEIAHILIHIRLRHAPAIAGRNALSASAHSYKFHIRNYFPHTAGDEGKHDGLVAVQMLQKRVRAVSP